MNRHVAELWSTTEIVVWPEDFVVADVPTKAYPEVIKLLAGVGNPFVALVFEPDQVSVTLPKPIWDKSGLVSAARGVGGPFGLVTLRQDVGLDVAGYLAPPIQRLAEAGIAIIPHGAYLKEHWLFLKPDLPLAVAILRTYVAEQHESLRTVRRGDPADGDADRPHGREASSDSTRVAEHIATDVVDRRPADVPEMRVSANNSVG